MEDTNVIITKTLREAQDYCFDKMNAYRAAHPGTDRKNIVKATKMIVKARSVNALAIDVANFVLAHTSENLSVI